MVLAGAYVDLHDAAAAAPGKKDQVRQTQDTSSLFIRATLSINGDGTSPAFKGACVS